MIPDEKAELRGRLMARRDALQASAIAAAGRAAARRLLPLLDLADGRRVSVFWPLGSEIDTRPLIHALHHLGAQILLPRTQARGKPLSFHAWTPDLVLERSRFGVMQPPATVEALDPEIIIAPLLAFDRSCNRLGYGAGHYDCTVAALAAKGLHPPRFGLALAVQQVESVPIEPHDARLDLVVTEAAVHKPA